MDGNRVQPPDSCPPVALPSEDSAKKSRKKLTVPSTEPRRRKHTTFFRMSSGMGSCVPKEAVRPDNDNVLISSETALIVLHPLNCQDLLCHTLASSLSIPQRQKNRSTFFAFRQGIRDGTQVPVMCISSINLAGRENNASVGEYFSDFSLCGNNLLIGKNMCSLRVHGMEFFIAVFFIISDNRSFRFADLPYDMYSLTDRCFQTFLIFINPIFKCQKTPGVADQPSHPAFGYIPAL